MQTRVFPFSQLNLSLCFYSWAGGYFLRLVFFAVLVLVCGGGWWWYLFLFIWLGAECLGGGFGEFSVFGWFLWVFFPLTRDPLTLYR